MTDPRHASRRRSIHLLLSVVTATLIASQVAVPPAAGAGDVGYRDFSYKGVSAPTGQKPESKLWYTSDGWFGVLWNRTAARWRIQKFNWSTDTWTDTGVTVDSRAKAEVDALWDEQNQKLYVAAHIKEATTTTNMAAYLYRFSYTGGAYAQDAGFPVAVTSGAIEALVIDRDSTGVVWATWTTAAGRGRKVLVTHATSNANAAFVTPYTPPVGNADTLDADDISTLVAYDGQIGVMWSNQRDNGVFFASHQDGAPDTEWARNPALSGPKWADDHLNIKSLSADPAGRVYAAVKTSLNDVNAATSAEPLILLLVLDGNGTWKRSTVDRIVDGDQTRPIVLVSPDTRQVFVLSAGPCCSGGVVRIKSASLDKPDFPTGLGDPFIQLASDTTINNPSSTKQPVTAASGLLVIAGDDHSLYYVHNKMTLTGGGGGGEDTTPPTVALTGPADGARVGGLTTISASATDNVGVARVDFAVGGSAAGSDAAAPFATPFDFSSSPEGPVTITAQAFDATGNASVVASRSVTVDHAPPDTTITQQPADPSSVATATFAFGATEPATFTCSLDGAAYSVCTSPATYAGLANGQHTFGVVATDQAGNVDPTPATASWTVTVTAPATIFSDGFESGSFSAWSAPVIGGDGTAVVQGATVRSGSWAARLSATSASGSRAYVRKGLGGAYIDATVSGSFMIQAEGASGGNVPILRLFDGSGTRLLSVYRQNQAADAVYVAWTAGGSTVRLAGGRIPLGAWRDVRLHVIVNGAASTVELWIDGVLASSSSSASLGTSGVSTIQVGNDTSAQAFALVVDDVEVK